MNKWDILEIGSDADEETIQNAYYDKLEVTNPEENAAGFMELRKAYEEAMHELKNRNQQGIKGESAEIDADLWLYDQSPEGEWMKKARILYEDFSARIRVDNWISILKDPVCDNLDTKNNICERLLVFLMNHYYLPHSVFESMDQYLNLMENKREWLEKFPENYIDYIENEILYDDEFRYDLFDPLTVKDCEVYDQYLSQYYGMISLRKCGKLDEAKQIRDALDNSVVRHPFVKLDEMLIILQEMEYKSHTDKNLSKELQNKFGSLKIQLEDIFEEYQDVPLIQYTYAKVLFYSDRIEEAENIFDSLCKKLSKHVGVMRGSAECKIKKGELLEAKEIIYDVLQINNYDEMAHLLLEECNIRIREDEKENPLMVCNSPSDHDKLLELAWANSQSNDYSNALAVLGRWEMPENSEYELEKTYLTGFCYLHLDQVENAKIAFEDYQTQYNILMPTLKDKKLKDAKRRYYLSNYYLGEIALDVRNYEIAMSYNEIAKQGQDENLKIYQMQEAEIFLQMGRAEEALRVCEKISGNDAMYYILYAKIEKETGQYQNALAHLNKAISLFPYIIKAYILQMQIYAQFEQFDQVEEILLGCDKLKMPETREIKILRSLLLDFRNENQRAVIHCEEVLKEWNKDPKSFKSLGNDGIDYVHDMAKIFGRAECFELELHILDFALKEYPENVSLLYHKAYLIHERASNNKLSKNKEHEYEEEALYLLRKIVSLDENHRNAYGIIGDILEKNIADINEKDEYIKKREEAIDTYHKQCRNYDIAYYRISAGLLLQEAGRLGEAEEDFIQAGNLEENNPYASYNCGTNMLMSGNPKEAEEHFLLALQKIEDSKKPVPYIIYKGLLYAYCRQQKYEKAIQLCDDLISQNVYKLYVMYQKADILRITGQVKECIKVCKSALKNKENNLRSNFYDIWAQCYISKERDTKKSLWFRNYILFMQGVENVELHNDFAIDYMYRGDYGNAERFFSKALFSDEDNLQILTYTAYVCVQTGNLNRARKIINKVEKRIDFQLEFYRDRATYLRYSCMIHIAKSYLPEYNKERELEEAMKLASLYKVTPQCLSCKYTECFELIYLQGIIAHMQNDLEKAEEYMLQAVTIGSNEGECYRELRNIRKEMKRKK